MADGSAADPSAVFKAAPSLRTALLVSYSTLSIVSSLLFSLFWLAFVHRSPEGLLPFVALALAPLADSPSKKIWPDSGQNPVSRFSACKCFIFSLLRLDVCVACVILKLSSNPQCGRRPIPSPR